MTKTVRFLANTVMKITQFTDYFEDTENMGILNRDNHDDPGSKFWSIYNHLMESEDIYLTETWDKEMDFLLVYVSSTILYNTC